MGALPVVRVGTGSHLSEVAARRTGTVGQGRVKEKQVWSRLTKMTSHVRNDRSPLEATYIRFRNRSYGTSPEVAAVSSLILSRDWLRVHTSCTVHQPSMEHVFSVP